MNYLTERVFGMLTWFCVGIVALMFIFGLNDLLTKLLCSLAFGFVVGFVFKTEF